MGLARVSLAGVSLFVALACSSSCTKPTSTKLARPAPPAEGFADARVVFVAGDVEVTPAQGAAFPAKVGVDLVADDRVAPAASAKVVVVLRNGHAVRLDDTGALAVKDILLFSAPPTSRDVAEQLTALLDVDEKLPLDEVRDRAAAWRQMLRAGESAGAFQDATVFLHDGLALRHHFFGAQRGKRRVWGDDYVLGEGEGRGGGHDNG